MSCQNFMINEGKSQKEDMQNIYIFPDDMFSNISLQCNFFSDKLPYSLDDYILHVN